MAVSRFHEAWEGKLLDPPLQLVPPTEDCAYAQAIDSYGEVLLETLGRTPPERVPDALIHAKACLVDRWFEAEMAAPLIHTNAAGEEQHRCCDQALKTQMDHLREFARLTLPPPTLAPKPEASADEMARPFGIG